MPRVATRCESKRSGQGRNRTADTRIFNRCVIGPGSQLTGHHQTSYVNTSDGPITEAQQKEQQYGRDPVEITSDLAQVIEAWPTLPPAIREAILRAAE